MDILAKLRLANGLIMSKIIYMIQVWGSASPKWIKEVQLLQNKAAIYVRNGNRYSKISNLLAECKWLSVYQLVKYHSLLTLWKLYTLNRSSILLNRVAEESVNNTVLLTHGGRILLSQSAWRVRAVNDWNTLPLELREETNLNKFKGSLKTWILNNTRLKI